MQNLTDVRANSLTRRKALRCKAIFLALAMCSSAAPTVQAQDFPTRSITLVVPFPTGGPTDISARIVAQVLSTNLGQPIAIDNRGGAGGAIGSAVVARARPDGYTLLWGTASTMAVLPAVMRKLPYNPQKDLAPISLVARQPEVLLTRAAIPVRDIKQLISMAKAQPGKLTAGSSGHGTITHLVTERFKSDAAVDILHVPYKGGGPALIDLLGGQIDLMFETISSTLKYVQSGQLIPLAVTSSKRDPLLPNVPTVEEALGIPFEAYSFFGLVAPAGTPADILAKLSMGVRKTMENEEVRKALARDGFEVMSSSPEEFRSFAQQQMDLWSATAKSKDISID